MAVLSTVGIKVGAMAVCSNFIGSSIAYDTSIAYFPVSGVIKKSSLLQKKKKEEVFAACPEKKKDVKEKKKKFSLLRHTSRKKPQECAAEADPKEEREASDLQKEKNISLVNLRSWRFSLQVEHKRQMSLLKLKGECDDLRHDLFMKRITKCDDLLGLRKITNDVEKVQSPWEDLEDLDKVQAELQKLEAELQELA